MSAEMNDDDLVLVRRGDVRAAIRDWWGVEAEFAGTGIDADVPRRERLEAAVAEPAGDLRNELMGAFARLRVLLAKSTTAPCPLDQDLMLFDRGGMTFAVPMPRTPLEEDPSTVGKARPGQTRVYMDLRRVPDEPDDDYLFNGLGPGGRPFLQVEAWPEHFLAFGPITRSVPT